ncbi:MAG TPA: hypothetical protein VFZ59_24045 [Verrucomicrobiae bacterium]|nr:hypothetical protein [Verrucomicrobiae bacterium]
MKTPSNVVKQKLARVAATTVAATALATHDQASSHAPAKLASEGLVSSVSDIGASTADHHTECRVMWTVSDVPETWDKELEREFRQLALVEAKGELTTDQAIRLNRLNRLRDEMLFAPSPDEVLMQLKRDRILADMERLLREYVAFEEATNKARRST